MKRAKNANHLAGNEFVATEKLTFFFFFFEAMIFYFLRVKCALFKMYRLVLLDIILKRASGGKKTSKNALIKYVQIP